MINFKNIYLPKTLRIIIDFKLVK